MVDQSAGVGLPADMEDWIQILGIILVISYEL